MINSWNITFVIQGPVIIRSKLYSLSKIISKIKKYFPKSEIILSTWEGADISSLNLKSNQIILNKDPGAKYYNPFRKKRRLKLNNINRQIVSTISGLKKVNTKYAFKIRSDFLLTGRNFLDYFDKFNEYEMGYKIFKKRILVCSLPVRNPESKYKYPFHISDFAFFGLTEDLVDLFDIPLCSEKEFMWFNEKNMPYGTINRFVPEQHLMIKWLEKHKIDTNCSHYFDANEESIELTKHYMVNNFVILSYKQYSLQPLKWNLRIFRHIKSYLFHGYRHYDWLKMYKNFCDKSYKLPRFDYEFYLLLPFFLIRKIFNLSKNITRITIKILLFPKKVIQIINNK